MVGEAMKGGRLLAEVFQGRGYMVHPPPSSSQPLTPVASFITAIQLGTPKAMQAFCKAVQQKSPVGSYVLPIPGLDPSSLPPPPLEVGGGDTPKGSNLEVNVIYSRHPPSRSYVCLRCHQKHH
jgi:cystathionine beta-lyase family protein involved in aluminum resistance